MHLQFRQHGDENRFSLVDTALHGVETHPHWLIVDWLGFVEPAPIGEDSVSSRIRNPSIHLQLRQTGDENDGLLSRHLPARFGSPNPTG